ncbi:hypothetical protein CRE_23646 [Caenorhabditis remanei]|uniref:Uncharacterized protein n=1 Tax=Caenorhabditis remanei TaxID=31234 RepID=E3N495_CAERE|nr:hypothetical protein CRE_23646 [Caenorhabditis remanei]
MESDLIESHASHSSNRYPDRISPTSLLIFFMDIRIVSPEFHRKKEKIFDLVIFLVFVARQYLGDIVWKSAISLISFILFNIQYSLLNDVISKWESTEDLNDFILHTNT